MMRFWAWFDVHRASRQLVAASLLVAGVTFAVLVIASCQVALFVP